MRNRISIKFTKNSKNSASLYPDFNFTKQQNNSKFIFTFNHLKSLILKIYFNSY
jgi:hypothetical protein